MFFHVWFTTKYRKPLLVGDIDAKIKIIFAECIERHSYSVLEFETNIDHVHMLVEAKDKKELSAIMRRLKSVSARELHRATLCFRMGNGQEDCCKPKGFYRREPVGVQRSFWARRYGYRQIGEEEIEYMREYIRRQKDSTGGSL